MLQLISIEITASGSIVYVTWSTNKPGTLVPLFRASNDNGLLNRVSTVNESLVEELDLLMRIRSFWLIKIY